MDIYISPLQSFDTRVLFTRLLKLFYQFCYNYNARNVLYHKVVLFSGQAINIPRFDLSGSDLTSWSFSRCLEIHKINNIYPESWQHSKFSRALINKCFE